MKNLSIACIAMASLVVSAGCTGEGSDLLIKLLKGGRGSAVPVTVENVVLREYAQKMAVPASLEASDEIEITLPAEIVIDRAYVSEGDVVEAREALFHISEEDITARIAQTRLDQREAQTKFEKNTYFLRNRDRLLDEGRIDRNQYDNLEAEVEASDAAVEKLRLEITRLEERLANTTIASPIAGVVSKRYASAGMTMPANKPLAIITTVDPIYATFRLASHMATTVRPDMAVKIRFPDLRGEEATASITSVDTTLDQKDNMFAVKAAIPNPTGYLKVGMPAEVEFISPRKQRFYLIPAEALIRQRGRYFVFKVVKGVAQKVQVIPNETRGDRVEIVKGLRDDDLVVVKGHDKLTEGAVVDIWGR